MTKNCHKGHCNPDYEKYYTNNNLPFYLSKGGKIPDFKWGFYGYLFNPSGGLISDKLLISDNDFKTVNRIYRDY